MKRVMTICVLAAMMLTANSVYAGFYAITNQLGYSGTVWNITDGTSSYTTSSPRAATLYTVMDYDYTGWNDYNQLATNWYYHSTSNTGNSFFQLTDGGATTVTSSSASWDSTKTVFTCTVTGEDATYAEAYSRFWQPDTGLSGQVTIVDYTYTITATFADEAVLSDGYLYNTSSPVSIVGTFSGTFIGANGDTYGFSLTLSSDLFPGLTSGNVRNYFAASVPEPTTMVLLALGGLLCRKTRKA